MDFSSAFGVDFRTTSELEHEGQAARCVTASRSYPTDIEDLWDAVTNRERLPRWFLPISGDLEPGGRYQLQGHAGGTISRCDPPTAFDATWEVGENTSWIRLRFEAENNGTRLTLEHIMPKDDGSEAHWEKFGPGATGVGWELGFLGLDYHLSEKVAIDPAASQAWLMSDAGKAFVRQAAADWGDAHIAAGAPDTIATAMAERTASFYTGE